ncbi:MAG: hypothetical protein WCI92_05435 [Bacteroidota bacterium]
MKSRKEKKCPFCDEYYLYNRSSAGYCPNCNNKKINYLKQIRFQQNKLARRIFEMVKTLTLDDIKRLRREESENQCHDAHDKPASEPEVTPIVPPIEPPIIIDANFGRHRRKHH